jgi:hypothetical protein
VLHFPFSFKDFVVVRRIAGHGMMINVIRIERIEFRL